MTRPRPRPRERPTDQTDQPMRSSDLQLRVDTAPSLSPSQFVFPPRWITHFLAQFHVTPRRSKMISKISLFFCVAYWPVLLADPLPDSCDIISLYKELNCTPIYEKDSKCPVEYNCEKFLNFDPTKCYYNGVAYSKGSTLKEEECHDPCRFHCKCLSAWPNTGNAAWTCASGECFGDHYVPGCVSLHKDLNSCCRENTYCKATDKEPAHKCPYKGKTYVQGEIIYDDERCKRCICNSNFNETLEGPSCRDQSCGLLLDSIPRLREGCVPVYYGKSHCSCPIEYKCPETSDAVAQSTKQLDSIAQARKKCKFGKLSLNVGDKLVKRETENFECTCDTPPFLTCVQAPHEKLTTLKTQ